MESEEDFSKAWGAMEAKLTPSEREMVNDTVRGAQASHTVMYVAAGFAIGVLGGVATAGLLG